MKQFFIFVAYFLLTLPAFGQFRGGMIDYTGVKPVFRNDLNVITARELLSEKDCHNYLLGDKLFRTGTITAVSGMSVAIISAAVTFSIGGAETISLIGSIPNGGKGMDESKLKAFKVSTVFCYAGLGATIVGLGLMIAGSTIQIKISNDYFRDHPFSELNIKVSPVSLGLVMNL